MAICLLPRVKPCPCPLLMVFDGFEPVFNTLLIAWFHELFTARGNGSMLSQPFECRVGEQNVEIGLSGTSPPGRMVREALQSES